MTKEERAVIQAARALVKVQTVGRLTTHTVVQDHEKLGHLLAAVVALENNGGYWAER